MNLVEHFPKRVVSHNFASRIGAVNPILPQPLNMPVEERDIRPAAMTPGGHARSVVRPSARERSAAGAFLHLIVIADLAIRAGRNPGSGFVDDARGRVAK